LTLQKKILNLLFPLISFADEELYQYFLASGVEPFFALSWLLTWFSHGFDDLEVIARLFDLFIATHPLMPLYLSAQIILHFRDELLQRVECEYSAIHGFLTNIPQTLPFESLIKKTLVLFEQIPPKKLQVAARSIGSLSSVNKFPFDWMKEVQYQRPSKHQKKNIFSNDSNNYNYKLINSKSTEKLLFCTLFYSFIFLALAAFLYPYFSLK